MPPLGRIFRKRLGGGSSAASTPAEIPATPTLHPSSPRGAHDGAGQPFSSAASGSIGSGSGAQQYREPVSHALGARAAQDLGAATSPPPHSSPGQHDMGSAKESAAPSSSSSYQDGPSSSVLMPPGVSGGGLGLPRDGSEPVSSIPAVYVTTARAVPHDLDQYITDPGVPRTAATPDKFHPGGHELTPPANGRTSLQQHFDYFDINKDGHITILEMISGFRYLLGLTEPINTLLALPMAFLAQLPLAYMTGDSWIMDPRFIVKTKNAHKVVHGSTSKAWTHAGHFVPARFEAMLSKYDQGGKGGLTLLELLAFLRGQSGMGDVLGMTASSAEWLLTYWLLRDSTGVLRREDIRGMYDGTAFYRLAERNGHKHYGLAARQAALDKGMS